ncbi:MAG: tRNA (adenosine(37)-N6)-threonylcarbamoyltransferase complex ATPase subunit type 1 TsaE [Bacteroidetes bacterium]|nr:tRNA (adenosine(37)-N6)-threonylcarbamoyltransferase complex ATPase subunit type 1 TsaE [Bacteroidota bacterium]
MPSNFEISFDLSQIEEVASDLLRQFKSKKIWAFDAEMGAGKTTLILALIRQMSEMKPEGSPTYSLVNSYKSDEYGEIHHFDLYRLNSIEEALDIGIEEMIYDNLAFCFIEWPKKVEQLLPQETIWLYLSPLENGTRRLEVRL